MSALATSLVAAQKAMPQLSKDATADTGKFSYSYLSLASLLAQVLPVLNEQGLALMQAPCISEGRPALRTHLFHESGESQDDVMLLPVDGSATAQALGSALTYARRYAVLSVLALAPDEDDDGASASARPVQRTEAKPAASELRYEDAQLKLLNEHLAALNDGFPHPAEDWDWIKEAQKFCRDHWGKASVTALSKLEMQVLIEEMEARLTEQKSYEGATF